MTKSRNNRGKKLAAYAIIFIVAVAIDQFTKSLAVRHLKNAAPIPLIEPLIGLSYVENSGSAWGMLSGQRLILTVLPFTAIGVFTWYLIANFNSGTECLRLGIVFILGGAAGNLIDRMLRGGYVVDFLELRFIKFPVFNVADLCVTAGTILLAIHLLFLEGKKSE